MLYYNIEKSKFLGNITPPPSKSHTLRAIFFAFLAEGTSIINNYLPSPDTDIMINCCHALGGHIEKKEEKLIIYGCAGKITVKEKRIWVGNSGIAFRFMTALCACLSDEVIIDGDDSIRGNRPIKPLINSLSMLGAHIMIRGDKNAPLIIKGPLKDGSTDIVATDSQYLSALLIALSCLHHGKCELNILHMKEKPWVNMTLWWLDKLNIKYKNINFERFILEGKQKIKSFHFTVPSDFSSLSFPLVGTLINRGDITINNVDMNDVQGDKNIIPLLKSMGANIESLQEKKQLKVVGDKSLNALDIDGDGFIDAVPILSVLVCFTTGKMRIFNVVGAKDKECNRLQAMAHELNKMDGKVTAQEDGLIIEPSILKGATVNSHKDHRIAMALSMAAMASCGSSCIEDTSCVNKSYPHFVKSMQTIGGTIFEREKHVENG